MFKKKEKTGNQLLNEFYSHAFWDELTEQEECKCLYMTQKCLKDCDEPECVYNDFIKHYHKIVGGRHLPIGMDIRDYKALFPDLYHEYLEYKEIKKELGLLS